MSHNFRYLSNLSIFYHTLEFLRNFRTKHSSENGIVNFIETVYWVNKRMFEDFSSKNFANRLTPSLSQEIANAIEKSKEFFNRNGDSRWQGWLALTTD